MREKTESSVACNHHKVCRQNHHSKFYFSHIHVFQSGIVIGNTNSWHKDSGLHQEKMIQFYPFTILKNRI